MSGALVRLPGFKLLNDKQKAFLNALGGSAKGDIRTAMRIAGYSENTKLEEVTQNLTEFIKIIAKEKIALTSLKAAHGLEDLLDNPNQPGAKNKLGAAKEILDRANIKEEQEPVQVKVENMFILPPKKEANNLIIDVEPNE